MRAIWVPVNAYAWVDGWMDIDGLMDAYAYAWMDRCACVHGWMVYSTRRSSSTYRRTREVHPIDSGVHMVCMDGARGADAYMHMGIGGCRWMHGWIDGWMDVWMVQCKYGVRSGIPNDVWRKGIRRWRHTQRRGDINAAHRSIRIRGRCIRSSSCICSW